MAKYGPKASEKVEESMHEFKRGKLKSGSGKTVKDRDQAIAIGLSEARRSGGKVPKKSSGSSKKSSGSSKKSSGGSKKSSSSKKSSGGSKKSSSSRKSSSSSKKSSSKKSGSKKSG